MKRIILFVMAIAIASVNILFAGSPPYDSLKKMSFSPEKEKQIIEVARKVCEELAPDYMPKELTAGIYKYDVAPASSFIDKDAVAVKFMISSDNEMYNRWNIYSNPSGKPIHILMVVVNMKTMEPLFIRSRYKDGKMFMPNYADFRRQNPEYKLELYIPPVLKPDEVIIYEELI